ncbi:MAG: hypothetical protein WCQ95_14135 [Bacteroidota bacterium]
MAFDKEFLDNIVKLKLFRIIPEMLDFFEAIDELERIENAISDSVHHATNDTSNLLAKAKSMVKKLDSRKDEIAKRTKTQKEFDAVYNAIDYLVKHFA